MKRSFLTSLLTFVSRIVSPRKRLAMPLTKLSSLPPPAPLSISPPPLSPSLHNELLSVNPHLPSMPPSLPNDFRSVLSTPVSSDQAIHRVSVRSHLEAAQTTDSIEVGELDLLTTTHSSYIDSGSESSNSY